MSGWLDHLKLFKQAVYRYSYVASEAASDMVLHTPLIVQIFCSAIWLVIPFKQFWNFNIPKCLGGADHDPHL